MRVVLVIPFVFYVTTIADGYIVRPFPKGEPTGKGHEMMVKLRMPGAKLNLNGSSVMCTIFSLEGVGEIDLVQFKVIGSSKIAHHLNLYASAEVFSPVEDESSDPWGCPDFEPIFCWAKNAPPTRLPSSIGFKVGGKNRIQSLILGIHYSNEALSTQGTDFSGYDLYFTSREEKKHAAGFFSMHLNYGSFPPHKSITQVDACCKVENHIHVMAYFAHEHGMGRLVNGYKIKKNTTVFQEIGRGNPQWPQTFFPVNEVVDLEPGDTVAIRCVFDSTGVNTTTYTGINPDGVVTVAEMCYYNMLYYTDPQPKGNMTQPSYISCFDDECDSDMIFPDDASELLPPNPRLDQQAKFGNQTGIIKINEKTYLNLELQQIHNNIRQNQHFTAKPNLN